LYAKWIVENALEYDFAIAILARFRSVRDVCMCTSSLFGHVGERGHVSFQQE
jgi:hypothetical protein